MGRSFVALSTRKRVRPRSWRLRSLSHAEVRHNHHPVLTPRPTMPTSRASMGVELNFWNPLYALTPLVLLLVSIPLALFAILTSTFAISLLFCRAAIVYVELAVAIAGDWYHPPPKSSPLRSRTPPAASPEEPSPLRRRQHRRSNTGPSTPAPQTMHNKSTSLSTPLGMSGIARDFEGVGGWRSPGDDDEEAAWTGLNKRIPAEVTTRRHQRRLTGGSSPGRQQSRSPEALRMSPAQSRARTPASFVGDGDDYFLTSEPASHHRRNRSGGGGSFPTKTPA
jgi:hypothetical protein